MKLRGKAKQAFLRRMAAGRRKALKPRRTIRHSMARRRRFSRARRYSGRVRSSFRRRGGVRGIGGTLRPYATGIGMARITEQVVGRVAPQYAKWGALGGAYVGGGLKGVAGEIVYNVLTGQGGIIPSLTGGQTVMTEAL